MKQGTIPWYRLRGHNGRFKKAEPTATSIASTTLKASTTSWASTTLRTSTTSTDLPRHCTVKDLKDSEAFSKVFVKQDKLGEGGDGMVHSYRHRSTGDVIAVKVPNDKKEIASLELEAFYLDGLGQHNHIVEFLGYNEHHGPLGPAMFMRVADLGSLGHYRDALCKQQRQRGRPGQPDELTIWKLLRDMTLALDFLHNHFQSAYVHRDVKPGNILVRTPDGYDTTAGIPTVPIFVLADFSRLTPHPTPEGETPKRWNGTPEYAPSPAERRSQVKPCTDIWRLGATIQDFALGKSPHQSKVDFMLDQKMQGLRHPNLDDRETWAKTQWQYARPVIWRPINAPPEQYAYMRDYRPYSAELNTVYTSLMNRDPKRRPTSQELARQQVPLIDKKLKMTKNWRL
ncbi:kinase-like protein [Setomelanomma holmii]|uniref:Kinase-like protein n=1 Tax=Setomelanomma holmii TaxID=210430 RepID=A0A9P4LMM3_9PLEO|nr:kinase-like protein [Setomelanomma holmii]